MPPFSYGCVFGWSSAVFATLLSPREPGTNQRRSHYSVSNLCHFLCSDNSFALCFGANSVCRCYCVFKQLLFRCFSWKRCVFKFFRFQTTVLWTALSSVSTFNRFEMETRTQKLRHSLRFHTETQQWKRGLKDRLCSQILVNFQIGNFFWGTQFLSKVCHLSWWIRTSSMKLLPKVIWTPSNHEITNRNGVIAKLDLHCMPDIQSDDNYR